MFCQIPCLLATSTKRFSKIQKPLLVAWVQHSRNVGIAARNIAGRVSGLDPDKAYTLGLLHDIGRRVGVVGVVRHVWEGYRYCMENWWDEVARVCICHINKTFLQNTETPACGKAITQLNQEIIITAKNIFPYPRCFFFLQNNIKFFSCQWK